MNFRDDHSKPLWVERSDHTWGSDLTYTERDLEDLDGRPSRPRIPSCEATGRRASHSTEEQP